MYYLYLLGGSGGASRESCGLRGGRAEADQPRQQHPDLGADVGQRALVALARRLPDHPEEQRPQEVTLRQVLPHRPRRQRARRRHILGQQADT